MDRYLADEHDIDREHKAQFLLGLYGMNVCSLHRLTVCVYSVLMYVTMGVPSCYLMCLHSSHHSHLLR